MGIECSLTGQVVKDRKREHLAKAIDGVTGCQLICHDDGCIRVKKHQ